MHCQFVSKLPSLADHMVVPPIAPPAAVAPVPATNVGSLATMGPPLYPLPPSLPQLRGPAPSGGPSTPNGPIAPISLFMPPPPALAPETSWKHVVELKIDAFDAKLNNVVDILRYQQHLLAQGGGVNNGTLRPPPPPLILSLDSERELTPLGLPPAHKRRRTYPPDFRQGFLSRDQANELFGFFNANIAQQLFGFEINKISVDQVWDLCPLLVCAISAIASIHHPKHSDKLAQLRVYLHDLCGLILFKGKPTNPEDGFNTILALVLCSFWLANSQMFTGLALQLAKEYGFDKHTNKDYLKLWYLLFVLDGQQSLLMNRVPLIDGNEYTLTHSRELLGGPTGVNAITQAPRTQPTDEEEEDGQKLTAVAVSTSTASTTTTTTTNEPQRYAASFTDLRLVSQVEYNQALNEAFKGNAWDLIAPSQFGIPLKLNLELDKWMVLWTVLLAPGNHGAVWLLKSTLIYYNFAKMLINSQALRKLHINPVDELMPLWDDSEDDEFLSNTSTLRDGAVVLANLAVSAAQTVLLLVVNDKDILDNLRYVPVHIHIMLYYAALVVLNPPLQLSNTEETITKPAHLITILKNLRLIKTLQKKIMLNLPVDTKFGNRLVRNIDDIIRARFDEVMRDVDGLNDDDKRDVLEHVDALHEMNHQLYEEVHSGSDNNSSRGSTSPGPEKILAWPGRNHSHP